MGKLTAFNHHNHTVYFIIFLYKVNHFYVNFKINLNIIMTRITLIFCYKSVKVKLLEIIKFGYPILIILILIEPIQVPCIKGMKERFL